MAQPLSAPSVEPLTSPRPLVFPTEAAVPESKDHFDLRTALYLVLRRAFADRASIGSDQFVYYDETDPARVIAPDVFLRRGGPDGPFASWKVWERGVPEIAIEIISASDAPPLEWDKKLAKYQALGVAELMRFEAGASAPLRAWDRLGGDLVERRLDRPRATSRVLALDLVVVDGTLRFEQHGVILPTPDERADAEFARATEEAKRAAAESKRAAAESKRAAAERKRAAAESKRATAEAERADRLRAKLVAAGIDPDELGPAGK